MCPYPYYLITLVHVSYLPKCYSSCTVTTRYLTKFSQDGCHGIYLLLNNLTKIWTSRNCMLEKFQNHEWERVDSPFIQIPPS